MTASYSTLKKQIDALQRKADILRKKEVAGVVGRIKDAIRAYGLTSTDLGFDRVVAPKTQKTNQMSVKASRKAFGDGLGNTWGGRGPHPAWLREAIKGGKTLDDFRGISGKPGHAPKPKGAVKKVAPKYRDSGGNTWAGRGRQPRWLVAALKEGASLESLAV